MKKIIIISEIGINHNGDLDLAKKMIMESKNCGADLVKFQKRDINIVYDKQTLDSKRESPWGSTTREQKLGLEFEKKEYDEIEIFCQKVGIDWFASAWDLKSLEFLKLYNKKYNKIPSAMIIDLNFLNEVAKQKKHTFISTGMCTFLDIERAVNIFRKNNCSFELMHCVSAYPFDNDKANLQFIPILRKKFKCDVGYSGHEKGGQAISYAATALGITSLERHFTLDRSIYGSDQAASITPDGFRRLISGARDIEIALNGDKEKIILPEELEVAKKLRAHIKDEFKIKN
jgi:N-acetylneuraminate synthase